MGLVGVRVEPPVRLSPQHLDCGRGRHPCAPWLHCTPLFFAGAYARALWATHLQCSAKRSIRHPADAAFARQARTCAAWTCSCSAARPHPSLERRPPPAWLQLRARACARNLPDTPRHGGEATVTGCLCDGNSRGKQPAVDCRRTGSQIENEHRTRLVSTTPRLIESSAADCQKA